jgi:lipopolysaccharide cholinephosphotransferase
MDSNIAALSDTDLRKLQMVLLEILVETDRICKKHNIKYCIVGGTLIGAVRHKGFIPWDDDLDISMSRREYDRFREVCKTELDTSRYFFQDHTTDPKYNHYFGKVLRNGTTFVTADEYNFEKRSGISVDIFINDGVPDFYPLRVFNHLYCYWLRKHFHSYAGKDNAKRWYARFVYRILSKKPIKATFDKLDRMAEYYADKKTKRVRHYSLPIQRLHRFRLGRPRAWHEDLCELEFEGLRFPAPKQWHENLTYTYGDYMTLPPPDQRLGHSVKKLKLPEECEFYNRLTNKNLST